MSATDPLHIQVAEKTTSRRIVPANRQVYDLPTKRQLEPAANSVPECSPVERYLRSQTGGSRLRSLAGARL